MKPSKYLLPHVLATRSGLDAALAFANSLYLALEARGHHVVLAPNHERFHGAEVDPREVARSEYTDLWHPRRITVTYVGTVAFGLAIAELSEQADSKCVDGTYVRLSELPVGRRRRSPWPDEWVPKHDFPTGRLLLKAYSPYRQATWSHEWREMAVGELAAGLPTIIDLLEAAAPKVAELYAAGEHREQIELERRAEEHARWEREDRTRREVQARAESLAELRKLIAEWDEAVRTDAFFAAAIDRLGALDDSSKSAAMTRLQRARDLFGAVDPLARLSDWALPEERLGRSSAF